MTITEWFNPSLPEHREAYRHLQQRGTWPANFIPNDLEFPMLWPLLLASKIADFYLNHIRLADRFLRPTFGAWAQEEERP